MLLIHRCLDREGIHQISQITKVTKQLRKKIKHLPKMKLKDVEICDLND